MPDNLDEERLQDSRGSRDSGAQGGSEPVCTDFPCSQIACHSTANWIGDFKCCSDFRASVSSTATQVLGAMDDPVLWCAHRLLQT